MQTVSDVTFSHRVPASCICLQKKVWGVNLFGWLESLGKRQVQVPRGYIPRVPMVHLALSIAPTFFFECLKKLLRSSWSFDSLSGFGWRNPALDRGDSELSLCQKRNLLSKASSHSFCAPLYPKTVLDLRFSFPMTSVGQAPSSYTQIHIIKGRYGFQHDTGGLLGFDYSMKRLCFSSLKRTRACLKEYRGEYKKSYLRKKDIGLLAKDWLYHLYLYQNHYFYYYITRLHSRKTSEIWNDTLLYALLMASFSASH